MTRHRAGLGPFAIVVATLVLACGPGVSPSMPTTTSATGDDTTPEVSTAAASDTTSIADGGTTIVGDSSSGGVELREYTGFWSQGTTDTPFDYRSFAPCNMPETWDIEGALPEVSECDGVASMYLRVLGERLPPSGDRRSTLIVHEVLEGPCWQHSCSGGDPCDCTTVEALCSSLPGSAYSCDLVHQNCPRGDKCMPWANDGGMQWNASRCSQVSELPQQAGDPCLVEGWIYSGVDDCDRGLMCWNVDITTNIGTCVALCDMDQCQADPFCEDPRTTCVGVDDDAVRVCLPMCDPLAPDCAPSYSCQETPTGSFCLP